MSLVTTLPAPITSRRRCHARHDDDIAADPDVVLDVHRDRVLTSVGAQRGLDRVPRRADADVRPEHDAVADVDVGIVDDHEVEVRVEALADEDVRPVRREERPLDPHRVAHRPQQLAQQSRPLGGLARPGVVEVVEQLLAVRALALERLQALAHVDVELAAVHPRPHLVVPAGHDASASSSASVRPLTTDSGRSATMSEPGRASSSRRLISSHCGLAPGRVRWSAKPPRSFSPCRTKTAWPRSSASGQATRPPCS